MSVMYARGPVYVAPFDASMGCNTVMVHGPASARMDGAADTRHLVDEAAQMKQLIEISKIQPVK